MNRIVWCLVAALGVASPVAAQVCLGAPSFDDAPYQARADVDLANGSQQLLGSISAGQAAGLFGGIHGGVANYHDLNATARIIGGSVGSDVRIGGGPLRICPLVSINDGFGPNTAGLTINQLALSFGGRVGVIVSDTAIARLIPTLGLSMIQERAHVRAAGGQARTATEAIGDLDVGLGVVFHDRVSVIPGVEIPVDAAGARDVFTVVVAVNFGR